MRTDLSQLDPGRADRVAGIALDAHEAEWLRAVGLFEGVEVVVLRRAPLGGPLHLRTASGAEFAIDRALATSVAVDVGGAA